MTIAQPPELMVDAVVQRMRRDNIKTVGFIGFSDSWGDLVYNSLTKSAQPAGINVTSNERYARADTSVTAQVLKVVASRPDAVMNGGSGTPGALPLWRCSSASALPRPPIRQPRADQRGLCARRRCAAEGVIAPTGPVIVAEQLPDSNPTKRVSLAFREAFQKTHNARQPTPFQPIPSTAGSWSSMPRSGCWPRT